MKKLLTVKVKTTTVYRTDSMAEALRVVGKLFKKGQSDIYLNGGRIGKILE